MKRFLLASPLALALACGGQHRAPTTPRLRVVVERVVKCLIESIPVTVEPTTEKVKP